MPIHYIYENLHTICHVLALKKWHRDIIISTTRKTTFNKKFGISQAVNSVIFVLIAINAITPINEFVYRNINMALKSFLALSLKHYGLPLDFLERIKII